MRVRQLQLIDGKYRIVRLLGKGGAGSVYEAVNVGIDRRVAIKIPTEVLDSPELIERLQREARASTLIDSPYVVSILDMGRLEDGRPYLVMELLCGRNLADEIGDQGAMRPERALELILPILRGLQDCHAAGVLHRDVKPENIILVRQRDGHESVKLVDFGICKLTRSNQALTQSVAGTPMYMSPEQCQGRAADRRSDLYAAGVVLYEMLTGSVPHSAPSVGELLVEISTKDAPDPRVLRPELDPALASIVRRALVRDPDGRFQSAEEFEHALCDWARDRAVDVRGASERTTGPRANVSGRVEGSARSIAKSSTTLDEVEIRPTAVSSADHRPSRPTVRIALSGLAGALALAVVVGVGGGVWRTAGRSVDMGASTNAVHVKGGTVGAAPSSAASAAEPLEPPSKSASAVDLPSPAGSAASRAPSAATAGSSAARRETPRVASPLRATAPAAPPPPPSELRRSPTREPERTSSKRAGTFMLEGRVVQTSL